jgi:hypothetical protein
VLPVGHINCLAGRSLREEIAYTIDDRPGLVRIWCTEFQLWGSGRTIYDAIHELQNALEATWADYVMTDDASLGPDAVKQKQRLRWLMGDLPISSTSTEGDAINP